MEWLFPDEENRFTSASEFRQRHLISAMREKAQFPLGR